MAQNETFLVHIKHCEHATKVGVVIGKVNEFELRHLVEMIDYDLGNFQF